MKCFGTLFHLWIPRQKQSSKTEWSEVSYPKRYSLQVRRILHTQILGTALKHQEKPSTSQNLDRAPSTATTPLLEILISIAMEEDFGACATHEASKRATVHTLWDLAWFTTILEWICYLLLVSRESTMPFGWMRVGNARSISPSRAREFSLCPVRRATAEDCSGKAKRCHKRVIANKSKTHAQL